MARPVADPHALSLKVLRLSRPTLATQSALPDTSYSDGLTIKKESSHAYVSDHGSSFPLTPLLTLPAAFGLAYVGESFACTLCVSNELESKHGRRVEGVQLSATMQTPTDRAGTILKTTRADPDPADSLSPSQTMQLIVRQDLKEPGPHVLAVTLTYTEVPEEGEPRKRTFRKLYQFNAQQLIAIRSKVSARKADARGQKRWIIEAQLENVGESTVTIEKVTAMAKDGLSAEALDSEALRCVPTTLKPQDVEQTIFLVEQTTLVPLPAGRQLAQLTVTWRGAVGEPGHLSTGWLISKEG